MACAFKRLPLLPEYCLTLGAGVDFEPRPKNEVLLKSATEITEAKKKFLLLPVFDVADFYWIVPFLPNF